jgi:hypothetical protein
MSRLLTDNSYWRRFSAITLYRIASGTPGDTTTTAPVAKSATTIPVVGITNFTAADPAFLIGSGGFELISAIGTPNVTMPITNQKVHFAQSTGARFVEAVAVSLGRFSKDGAGITPSRTLTAVEAADRDLPIGYFESALEISCTFGLLEYEGLNWQFICGYEDSEIGTGVVADPFQAALGENDQVLMSNVALRLTGIRADAKNIQFDMLDCRFETSGQVTHNRSGEAILPVTAKFTRALIRRW